jgi:intraflagellar transport protein 80
MKGHFNESLIHSYILLLSNKVSEAEAVLLQSKLIYRAIKLNINLFRWERAYALALENKVHIDTVLAYRNKYLEGAGLEETNSKFIELAKEVKVDWTKIKAKIEEDKKAEKIK